MAENLMSPQGYRNARAGGCPRPFSAGSATPQKALRHYVVLRAPLSAA